MNKDTKKIYKTLTKAINKNEKELLKFCQEFTKTKNYDLLPDLEYYADCLFNDSQQLLLIEIVSGKDE